MSERKGTKALELWCKRLVRDFPDVRIENMTTSWRNGVAFCALVHHFRPDLIDMSKLNPENIYENNQLAFSVAEKHLGIPALLDPEDMVENDVPDRLSILTYLSQFYQRLGHTVNTKAVESETKTLTPKKLESIEPVAQIKFGKTGLDKCTACGLPVYLAQRLMVTHKLYHRRCFRCSKCSGHLNPKNYHVIEGSEFSCDSCKNEKTLLKYLNNNDNDQMGMLAFNESVYDVNIPLENEGLISSKQKTRPQSILEKINMFEKNIEKDSNIENKMTNLDIKDHSNNKYKELSSTSLKQNEDHSKQLSSSINISMESEILVPKNTPEKVYKSNINKFNFLQTQLMGDTTDIECDMNTTKQEVKEIDDSNKHLEDNIEECLSATVEINDYIDDNSKIQTSIEITEESNVTDDNRIAKIPCNPPNVEIKSTEQPGKSESTNEITITVPPRRKKLNAIEKKTLPENVNDSIKNSEDILYPDHLNPFSDDDEEEDETVKKVSTNPFGSSDEEDDDVPPMQSPPKVPSKETPTPVKRLIAVNPFWSDGEEPSSEEEKDSKSSTMYNSSIAASTPNLPASTPRRKKTKAPPPPIITVTGSPRFEHNSTSMDDVASISSLSSFNSTINSDQKSCDKSTPLSKKRPAPTPPDSLSTVSGYGGSLEKGVDSSEMRNTSDGFGKRTKGPAPGLPLPERREVKMQMSPEELQVQLDLLETQQLGLERQGVLIERMIRDKCEGDEATIAPQEEVEDLVIQLCELVNEKNDLFRKQTELMYIRRQQRLEQEQADIEHEIRIIQSRPAVNRIDADKAREEQLVSRLVEIVRMRDELVQQIDAERRRERQEDLAIAASIANKRAQRNSESNSSSMKSVEVVTTPKKSKVKDKVKKQLKKAKHTLISKKKEDSEKKEEKTERKK